MQVIQYEPPEQAVILRPAEIAYSGAEALVIDCPEMLEVATTETQLVKERLTALDTMRKAITRPIDEAKAKIMDLFRPAVSTYEKTEKVLKDKIVAYQLEERRKAEEAERQAREEARRAQEAAAREAAAKEAAAQAAAEKLIAESKTAAESGDAGKAAELQVAAEQTVATAQDEAAAVQMAAAVVPTIAVPTPTMPKGASLRGRWKARVTDKAKFIAYIAAHPEFLELLDVNESALNKLAGALQKKLPIEGAEAYEDFTAAVRSR